MLHLFPFFFKNLEKPLRKKKEILGEKWTLTRKVGSKYRQDRWRWQKQKKKDISIYIQREFIFNLGYFIFEKKKNMWENFCLRRWKFSAWKNGTKQKENSRFPRFGQSFGFELYVTRPFWKHRGKVALGFCLLFFFFDATPEFFSPFFFNVHYRS